jgi:uncharacterized membrane protein
MVPEHKVIRLEMSVPDAIKYVISLGAILPGNILSGQDFKTARGALPSLPGAGPQ